MPEYLLMSKPQSVQEIVTPRESGVPFVAIGIWTGLAAVLLLPSLGKTRRRVSESDLLRAYGIAMSVFPLL